YGEKVDVRILMYPKSEMKNLFKIHQQACSSDEEFERLVRMQPNEQLRAIGGKVQPIGRFSGNDEKLEKVAFTLRPGEVSELIEVGENEVILKCIGRVPPDRKKIFENEREALKREVADKLTQKAIGDVFKE